MAGFLPHAISSCFSLNFVSVLHRIASTGSLVFEVYEDISFSVPNQSVMSSSWELLEMKREDAVVQVNRAGCSVPLNALLHCGPSLLMCAVGSVHIYIYI